MLPATNPKEIDKRLQGIMLKTQLYGREKDLCASIISTGIASEEGLAAIVPAIHKQDALSVLTKVYQDSFDMLNTKRGPSRLF